MQQMWYIINAILVVFLGVEAVVDYRHRNISAVCAVTVLAALAACNLICGNMGGKIYYAECFPEHSSLC